MYCIFLNIQNADNYNEARDYCGSRRANVPPPVYNAHRMLESPIPNIGMEMEHIVVEEDRPYEVKAEYEHFDMDLQDVDMFEDILNGSIDDDDITIDNVDSADDVQTQTVATNSDLIAQGAVNIHDSIVFDEDGVTFDVPEQGVFPMPMLCSARGLIKREDDPISGGLAYSTDKVGRHVHHSNARF